MGDRPLSAFASEASQAEMGRKKSFLPDGAKVSDLINEESSESMSFYYEQVRARAKESGGS